MSAVGSCLDNDAVESFSGLLKRERLSWRQYRTRAEAKADILYDIERWQNFQQRGRLVRQQQGERLLTQSYVKNG